VERLLAEYTFTDNVQLMDGGTLGLRLLGYLAEADRLIVVDAVRNDQPPGTFYRLSADGLTKCISFKSSLHQTGLLETLACAEMLGHQPETVIIGVEPADISPWGTELTESIRACVEPLALNVLEEIRKAGGAYQSIQKEPLSQPARDG
jgi:hydrogenase maturation protease